MSGFNHTPYDGSAEPFTLGLAPCDEADWIEPDALLSQHLLEKDRLLTEASETVYRTTSGMTEAETELVSLLADHLPRHHPHLYRRDGNAITVMPMKRQFDLTGVGHAPLTLAGRLAQEDFCLIRPLTDGTHELGAACLCFPSSWSLAEKIGRPLEAVHGPVPGYRADLADRVNRLFTRLPAGRILCRTNWSLDEGPALHRPQPHSHDRWLAENGDPLDHVFVRTERQTVRRLPETGVIVFTIKIGQDALSTLKDHPQAANLAAGMARQLRAMTAAQAAYKGLAQARPTILKTLAAISGGPLD